MEALRLEKEALREELRSHQALGAGVEALVQERLKASERDKYSVFIGERALQTKRRAMMMIIICAPGGNTRTR